MTNLSDSTPEVKRAILQQNIPAELQALKQWVVYRLEPNRRGKLTKVPYRAAAPRYKASTDNPKSWGTFAQAAAALSYPGVSGIGYVFTENDPYTGIDFDKCVANEVIDPDALQWVESFDSYSEFSQSETGIHAIVKATLTDGVGRKVGNLEIYDRLRFFAMTGDHIPGTPKTITEAQNTALSFISYLNTLQPEKATSNPTAQPPAATATPLILADNELLAVMFASKNGAKLQAIWNGNATGHKSTSEADLALAGALAFFCGGDAARVESLMLSSGLNREKFTEKHGETTYLRCTIGKAIRNCKGFYRPARADVTWAKLKALREFVENCDWSFFDRRSDTMQRCALAILKRFESEHSTEVYFSISQIATLAGVGIRTALRAINGNVNKDTGEMSTGLLDVLPVVRTQKGNGLLASCYAISDTTFARMLAHHKDGSNTQPCVTHAVVVCQHSRKSFTKTVEQNLSEDAFQRGGTRNKRVSERSEASERIAFDECSAAEQAKRVEALSRLFNAEVKVNEPAKSFSNLSLSILAYLDATPTKSARLSEIAEALVKHPATARSALKRMTEGVRLHGCEPIVEIDTLSEPGSPILVTLPVDWQERVNLARPYLASYGKHEQRLQATALKRLKRLEIIGHWARREDTKQMIAEIANRQRSILAYADGDLQRVDQLLNRVESHIAEHEPEAVDTLAEVAAHPAAPDWSQLDWTGETVAVEVAPKRAKTPVAPPQRPLVQMPAATMPEEVTTAAPALEGVTLQVTERLILGHPSDENFGKRLYF